VANRPAGAGGRYLRRESDSDRRNREPYSRATEYSTVTTALTTFSTVLVS